MMSIKKWDEADRPRERLIAHGPRFLSDSELLAILLGSGTKELNALELARLILESVENNLDTLSSLSIDELMQTKGIGQAKAVHLSAAFELGKRLQHTQTQRPKITCSNDIFQLLLPKLQHLSQEEFWVIFLNRNNRVISFERIHIGTSVATLVDIKLILKKALNKSAEAIIIAHNHPSGNHHPSAQDKEITTKLKNAAELMDTKLLDHLIFTSTDYFSFLDEGLL